MNKIRRAIERRVKKIMNENIDYKIFPFQCFALTIIGLWYPNNANFNKFHLLILKLLRTFVLFVEISTNLQISVYIFSNINTEDFEIMAIFFFLVTNMFLFETIVIIGQRDTITKLIKSYYNDCYLDCKDEEERILRKKYIKKIR